MPPPRRVPPELARAPFSRATALSHISRHALSGPAYQRLLRGGYWVAGAEVDHGRRIEVVRSVLPPDAVLRGLSAAWAHGVLLASADHPVEVLLPHERRVRSRPGVLLVSGERVAEGELVQTRSGPATSPVRTAFDLARRLPPDRAVAATDALLRAGSATVEDLLRVIRANPGIRGRRQALAVAALADPRAESVRESMLRMALVTAGLPAPVPQFEIRVDGRVLARLDLAWPELLVGLEYDGDHHRERRQHSRDLARHNELRALGWTVFQVDARQYHRLGPLLERLERLLVERAG